MAIAFYAEDTNLPPIKQGDANHTGRTGQFSPASLPIRVHPRGRFMVASLE